MEEFPPGLLERYKTTNIVRFDEFHSFIINEFRTEHKKDTVQTFFKQILSISLLLSGRCIVGHPEGEASCVALSS